MTVLENIFSAPIAWRRSTIFRARMRRHIDRWVAAAIARRERAATRAVLRHLNDRDLKDIGLHPSQIDCGLDAAARERAQMQRRVGAVRQRARTDLLRARTDLG